MTETQTEHNNEKDSVQQTKNCCCTKKMVVLERQIYGLQKAIFEMRQRIETLKDSIRR